VRLDFARRALPRLRETRDGSAFLRIVSAAVSTYTAGRCPQFAASISYHVLLSVFPFALLVATVGGLLLQDDARRADVADVIADRVPLLEEAGVDLDAALSVSVSSLGVLGLISVVALLWSASGMMTSLRIGLNAAWGTQTHPYVRGKLIDAVLVVALNVFVVLSVALTLLQPLFPPPWSSWLTTGFLGTAAGWFIALTVLYRFAPSVRSGTRELLGGAAVAAVAVTALQSGFSVYADRFADYAAVYGSLATVVAFLVYVYLSAAIVLFGGAFAAAWSRAAE
jgi:membrane protein